MKRIRAVVAAGTLVAGIVACGIALAQAPASPSAATRAPAAAAPASSQPSAATRVENWTRKQWKAAQKEWVKDKAKWANCQKRSTAQKLSGRKSWSFLYQCMTS
jgi:hypothetical protein